MLASALQSSPQTWGVVASVGAGLATAAGPLALLWIKGCSNRLVAAMLGLASGVMLSASYYSLLLPAWRIQSASGALLTAGLVLAAGFVVGAVVLWLADRFFPQEILVRERAVDQSTRKRAWLLVLAMTLHNFPEGLAVGVGFGTANVADGMAITAGVALQNLPKGLLTGLALMTAHYRRLHVFSIVALTGLVEIIGGLLGVWAISTVAALVPVTLAFSAGAMVYVVVADLIPEIESMGQRRGAMLAALLGFVTTMLLDTMLT